jgi:hypothetical protein
MRICTLITTLAAAVLAAPKSALVARARDSPELPGIDDEKFISTVLNAHWYWRRVHCAQDLAAMALKDIRTCTKDLEHMISARIYTRTFRS